MQFLLRISAIFAVAARRLVAQQGLAVSTAIGLIASVAIVMSIPLYSDAVYYQVLQNELTRPSEEGEIQRPPFAFMFRYVGSLYGLLQWDDIQQVNDYLWEQGPELLGLPNQLKVRYFRTDNFRLFPASDAA
jgi:putative ABC transport system permease protein